jgi:alpha-beta hydrolase superfamily lysophospholipase
MNPAAIAAQGVALSLIVGWEGSTLWRLGRILVVLAITAGAMWVVRRAGHVGRGATVLLTGIGGLVAGVGVGGVYLARVGLSALTIAGVVASVTGIALLVSGSVSLIRSIRGWWRLLAVPAALALLVFVLYPLTVAVDATNRPATPLGQTTPADRGVEYHDVEFMTGDGVRLSGWYIPSANSAAVLLLHGAGSTRSAVLDHAVVLARHGYGALLIDTRGHGSSGGDAMDFGWYGDLDIAAAVSFLERQPDVDPTRIAVVGLSMGGEQAIAAAGVDGRIRAVVAEGVTGMQTADHGWVERYGAQGSIQLVIDRVMYGAAGVLSGADRPMSLRDAIRRSAPRPVLMIAGGDTASEAIAGRWFERASPRSAELWVVPGAGHTAALDTRPDGWEARVITFLDEALSPSPMDDAA